MLHVELLGTTSVTVRLSNPIVEYIDESEWANRSEFLRHWANVGWRVSRDPELAEALEWALDRPVQLHVLPEVRIAEVELEAISEQAEDTVAEVIPPETSTPDELTSLRESQLEALRSRVH